MSHSDPKGLKVKKFEQSYGDSQSDNQSDTELQTTEHVRPTRSKKNLTKPSQHTKANKKQEQKVKTTKKEVPKTQKEIKTPEDEGKTEPSTRVKKNESVKSIKDDFEDNSEYIGNEKPKQKRNRKNKIQDQYEKMQEIDKRANEIIELLYQVYDADVELYKKGKPADRKLKCILEVQKKLKELELAKSFLNQDGHLLFMEWLLPNDDTKQETSLTVKTHVLNLLMDMRPTKENLEAGIELEKLLKRYKKSRYQTLRELSSKIVEKWKILRALPSAWSA